jgi:glycosyltransferase involved in cell wall biosynthesis
MPTRNRGSLLRHSLASAVNQDFQDYEIIVSDNNSTDDTRTVADQFIASSRKIRYINPGRDLSMCDNWEYVLEHATGRYVLYLCDDDALAPNTLSYVHQLLDRLRMNVLVWRPGGYHHPDIPDPEVRGKFTYPYTSERLYRIASHPMIEALCRFDWGVNGIIPKMLNCAVSRDAIAACRERTGEFFVPPYPDFSAAAQLLSTDPSYYFIDLPLYVSGASVVSNAGIRFNRKQKHADYVSLFGRDLLAGVPYQMPYLVTSYFYATYLLFQKLYPQTFVADIDKRAYLETLFWELTQFEPYEDVSEEFKQLADYMRDFSGGDEMFERLWRAHDVAKRNGNAQPGSHGLVAQVKGLAWRSVSRYPRAFSFLARARGHKISEFSRKNVPSIGVAAQILSRHLDQYARSATTIEPTEVSSESFLKEWQ